MKKSFYLGLVLALSLLLVTGCQNPVKKVAEKAKEKVENSSKQVIEDVGKDVVNEVKEDAKDTIEKVTGNSKLTCTMTEASGDNTMTMKVDMDYDTTNNVPKNIIVTMDMTVQASVADSFKDLDLCSLYGDDNDLSGKCTSSINGNVITLKYEVDEKQMTKLIAENEDDQDKIKSYDTIKKAFEDEGYTCK